MELQKIRKIRSNRNLCKRLLVRKPLQKNVQPTTSQLDYVRCKRTRTETENNDSFNIEQDICPVGNQVQPSGGPAKPIFDQSIGFIKNNIHEEVFDVSVASIFLDFNPYIHDEHKLCDEMRMLLVNHTSLCLNLMARTFFTIYSTFDSAEIAKFLKSARRRIDENQQLEAEIRTMGSTRLFYHLLIIAFDLGIWQWRNQYKCISPVEWIITCQDTHCRQHEWLCFFFSVFSLQDIRRNDMMLGGAHCMDIFLAREYRQSSLTGFEIENIVPNNMAKIINSGILMSSILVTFVDLKDIDSHESKANSMNSDKCSGNNSKSDDSNSTDNENPEYDPIISVLNEIEDDDIESEDDEFDESQLTCLHNDEMDDLNIETDEMFGNAEPNNQKPVSKHCTFQQLDSDGTSNNTGSKNEDADANFPQDELQILADDYSTDQRGLSSNRKQLPISNVSATQMKQIAQQLNANTLSSFLRQIIRIRTRSKTPYDFFYNLRFLEHNLLKRIQQIMYTHFTKKTINYYNITGRISLSNDLELPKIRNENNVFMSRFHILREKMADVGYGRAIWYRRNVGAGAGAIDKVKMKIEPQLNFRKPNLSGRKRSKAKKFICQSTAPSCSPRKMLGGWYPIMAAETDELLKQYTENRGWPNINGKIWNASDDIKSYFLFLPSNLFAIWSKELFGDDETIIRSKHKIVRCVRAMLRNEHARKLLIDCVHSTFEILRQFIHPDVWDLEFNFDQQTLHISYADKKAITYRGWFLFVYDETRICVINDKEHFIKSFDMNFELRNGLNNYSNRLVINSAGQYLENCAESWRQPRQTCRNDFYMWAFSKKTKISYQKRSNCFLLGEETGLRHKQAAISSCIWSIFEEVERNTYQKFEIAVDERGPCCMRNFTLISGTILKTAIRKTVEKYRREHDARLPADILQWQCEMRNSDQWTYRVHFEDGCSAYIGAGKLYTSFVEDHSLYAQFTSHQTDDDDDSGLITGVETTEALNAVLFLTKMRNLSTKIWLGDKIYLSVASSSYSTAHKSLQSLFVAYMTGCRSFFVERTRKMAAKTLNHAFKVQDKCLDYVLQVMQHESSVWGLYYFLQIASYWLMLSCGWFQQACPILCLREYLGLWDRQNYVDTLRLNPKTYFFYHTRVRPFDYVHNVRNICYHHLQLDKLWNCCANSDRWRKYVNFWYTSIYQNMLTSIEDVESTLNRICENEDADITFSLEMTVSLKKQQMPQFIRKMCDQIEKSTLDKDSAPKPTISEEMVFDYLVQLPNENVDGSLKEYRQKCIADLICAEKTAGE